MGLVSNISQHDIDLILQNTVGKVGISFRDINNVLVDPGQLSVVLSDTYGNELLTDVYFPVSSRSPNPPRILHPATGVFEFPFGLDNGSTDPNKRNRTSCTNDYLFTWTAALTASSKASVTIDPGLVPDSILIWTAVSEGTPGNFISVEYINPGVPNSPLAVVMNGAKVEVSLATNVLGIITTIANDIIAAVTASTEVSEIVVASLPTGSSGTGPITAVLETSLTGGTDATGEDTICVNAKVISHMMCSIIGKFRLLIDKTMKLINSDPNDPCYLGYTNGQLCQYLISGLQIINSYQPYGTFSLETFPFGSYDFILLETSLIAGMMSQSIFAIDTDVPQWNDQGNSFVITHYTQLAQYINWLSQRLDKLIPMFKLHFVQSGSLHIEAGPSFRLAQLINASPSGALFRNLYTRVI